jgi:hypothetical protein
LNLKKYKKMSWQLIWKIFKSFKKKPLTIKTWNYGNILDFFTMNVNVYWIMCIFLMLTFYFIWLNIIFCKKLCANWFFNFLLKCIEHKTIKFCHLLKIIMIYKLYKVYIYILWFIICDLVFLIFGNMLMNLNIIA